MIDRTPGRPLPGPGKRLCIFIGEAQEWQGQPLYQAIVELAQRHGAAGATVLRGIEGFGPEHHLSTEWIPDISDNLPLIVEIVESAAAVPSEPPLSPDGSGAGCARRRAGPFRR